MGPPPVLLRSGHGPPSVLRDLAAFSFSLSVVLGRPQRAAHPQVTGCVGTVLGVFMVVTVVHDAVWAREMDYVAQGQGRATR